MALGGGTSVGLLVKNRLVEPEKLVYLGPVRAVGVATSRRRDAESGPPTTLRELARSGRSLRAARCSPTPRRGSVTRGCARSRRSGGALVHGDPRQDLPPVLLALRAQVDLATASATRTVPRAVFVGLMETELGEGELATGITIAPRLRAGAPGTSPASPPPATTTSPTVGRRSVLLRWGEGRRRRGARPSPSAASAPLPCSLPMRSACSPARCPTGPGSTPSPRPRWPPPSRPRTTGARRPTSGTWSASGPGGRCRPSQPAPRILLAPAATGAATCSAPGACSPRHRSPSASATSPTSEAGAN